MGCDKYFELLSLRMDGALTEGEKQELEEHLAVCPNCRAAEWQLAAIHAAFDELEEEAAPEGFAQGVMDRIRAEETPKVIPLFKRPQFRALAGLAACLALVVGLYSTARPQKTEEDIMMARSFTQDALIADASDPMIAAYAAPEAEDSVPELYDSFKMVGSENAEPRETGPKYSMEQGAELVLTMDRLPEGAEELILSSEAASAVEVAQNGVVCFHCVTLEELEQVEQMAQEQDITASRGLGTEESGRYVIIVMNGIE